MPKHSPFRLISSPSPPGNFRSKPRSAMAAGTGCSIGRRTRRKWSATSKAVFDLHASSLEWLEKYTGIPYRFGKFDFVLIPSFQFGGMEHPGSIFYNAASILLDESATENQMLNRATHDRARNVAHVVRRSRHDAVVQRRLDEGSVRELHGGEDRESGISQRESRSAFSGFELSRGLCRRPNRRNASDPAGTWRTSTRPAACTAPSSMRRRRSSCGSSNAFLGPDKLQDGLRVYLKEFQFGNATWLDLIKILDESHANSISRRGAMPGSKKRDGRRSARSIEGRTCCVRPVGSAARPVVAVDAAHGRLDGHVEQRSLRFRSNCRRTRRN